MDFNSKKCYIFTLMKQNKFSFFKSISPSFGGSFQKGKRKTVRPLNPKTTLHLVLKSSRAKGTWSLLRREHKTRIHDLLQKIAKENGIKIYQYANVGNYLHLLLQLRDRKSFQKFLRVFSGRVALMITQAKRGRPQGKFWDELAFSRIVQWGNDFKRMISYLFKNELESLGYSTAFARELTQRGFVIFESEGQRRSSLKETL